MPHNAVTELCSPPGCGGFFLHQVLASLRERGGLAALVDCGKTFDPGSYDAAAFARLLTVFCETAEQSVKVTDLLLRDGNLPLVLLDLQTMPLRSLGRIPSNTWHRFQRLVERSGTALVVLTPQPIVEARARTDHVAGGLESGRAPAARAASCSRTSRRRFTAAENKFCPWRRCTAALPESEKNHVLVRRYFAPAIFAASCLALARGGVVPTHRDPGRRHGKGPRAGNDRTCGAQWRGARDGGHTGAGALPGFASRAAGSRTRGGRECPAAGNDRHRFALHRSDGGRSLRGRSATGENGRLGAVGTRRGGAISRA